MSGFGGVGSEGGVGPVGGDGLGGLGRVQFLLRLDVVDRERWGRAAGLLGVSVSELVRSCVNGRVAELLDCQHPVEFRRVYPWAESCLVCGVRLRDGKRGRRG